MDGAWRKLAMDKNPEYFLAHLFVFLLLIGVAGSCQSECLNGHSSFHPVVSISNYFLCVCIFLHFKEMRRFDDFNLPKSSGPAVDDTHYDFSLLD